MNEKLLKLIDEFKRGKRLNGFDEAATKQAVVLRILDCLGWNPYNIDEVHPEYSIRGKRVDYALKYNNHGKVFIEVKKISEDLEKHQEQLLNYSFQEGVKLAILTNGISWWFYLPLREGSWEQRKFYTIEIYAQDSNDIVTKFEEFLLKENVISGKAIENAEEIYKSKQKQHYIKGTLPKAWQKLITGPDKLLVDLLAETTEKLCGYKPNNNTVEQFLSKISETFVFQHNEKIKTFPRSRPKLNKMTTQLSSKSYAGRTVVSFTLQGKVYPVRSWKEMLVTTCNIIAHNHGKQFDNVLNLVGRKRPYFSKNPNELRRPEEIDNTGIYVETNRSADNIVDFTLQILALFGYKENEFSIELR